ncbi:equilibrative nucleoside transporter 2 isoform X4 [Ictalurus punctatus]|uniref:Equilibrative nucleoside transporter 2 isoform X4 n=1 Tax=Ictalurus punctatus TaxID=7998 RepID=A0A2D0QGH2_ICTPU|nr:equilibrative nucleoside transporter 2 isoform X4 [Ictalurus punctatus]
MCNPCTEVYMHHNHEDSTFPAKPRGNPSALFLTPAPRTRLNNGDSRGSTSRPYFNNRLNTSEWSNGTMTSTKEYYFNNWMTLLSQLPLLLFTLLNSILYPRISEKIRIAGSQVFILILFILTAILVKVPMVQDRFFSITMATIWFINSFGAVLQGSLFGLVGLLPQKYSTFFMSGQGLAGAFAALAMLMAIASDTNAETAALGYFITPCVGTLVTLISYLLLPKLIWVMAFCITSVFTVTLAVFPAVTVDVKTVYEGKWENYFIPVCCFLLFNVMDWIGRSITSHVRWPSKESRLFPALVVSRVLFIPLLMFCNVQERHFMPVLFGNDWSFAIIMVFFSVSSGYCVCLSMSYAPQLVASQDGETAGALMTFFLALGLSLGAALSFLLRLII